MTGRGLLPSLGIAQIIETKAKRGTCGPFFKVIEVAQAEKRAIQRALKNGKYYSEHGEELRERTGLGMMDRKGAV